MSEYLGSGHFGEATFENWESEFVQMATSVLHANGGVAEYNSEQEQRPFPRPKS